MEDQATASVPVTKKSRSSTAQTGSKYYRVRALEYLAAIPEHSVILYPGASAVIEVPEGETLTSLYAAYCEILEISAEEYNQSEGKQGILGTK